MTFKELRRQRGWTQREVATRVGVDQTLIAKIEAGLIRDPRFSTVDGLARVFRLSNRTIASLIANHEQAA